MKLSSQDMILIPMSLGGKKGATGKCKNWPSSLTRKLSDKGKRREMK